MLNIVPRESYAVLAEACCVPSASTAEGGTISSFGVVSSYRYTLTLTV